MNIFVYGTLMKGFQKNHYLVNCIYKGLTVIKANLYNLGNFPGILKGSNTITGELYEINEDDLKIIDDIEGFNCDKKKGIKNDSN